MRARDKVIILFCLLVGLAGASFQLYLQSKASHFMDQRAAHVSEK
jgi:hypothetical protein